MLLQFVDLTIAQNALVKGNLCVQVWKADTPELEERARNEQGVLLEEFDFKNLVVASGLDLLRDLLDTRTTHSVNGITHMALGTGNTAVAAGNTALVAEVLRAELTQSTKATAAVTFKYFLGTQVLNGTTIREAGLFNAPSGPIMFARRVITDIVKTNAIAVTFAWTINFAAS